MSIATLEPVKSIFHQPASVIGEVKGLTSQTETQAMAVLESHPHFRGRRSPIVCRCNEGCLYLNGELDSYYLKQLAQEALRGLDGVHRIENHIEVVEPTAGASPC